MVMTHEFEDANLAFTRDLFVFMNFTALSFVDLKELTTDNIVEVNGEKWIVGKRHNGVRSRTAAIQHRLDTAGLKRKIGKNQVQAIRIVLTGTHADMDMERECLQYGFTVEQTDKLLHGQRINYSGWLHSNEYRRNALVDNVTAQVIRDEKRNLFLHINETPITQWFKEQFGIGQEQRKGIRR